MSVFVSSTERKEQVEFQSPGELNQKALSLVVANLFFSEGFVIAVWVSSVRARRKLCEQKNSSFPAQKESSASSDAQFVKP